MRRFLFAALTFASLCCFTGCSEKGVNGETGDYTFISSHLSFNFHLEGDVASMVEVVPSCTIAADKGNVSSSSDGTKHNVFVSNINCPAKFNVVYTLKPKSTISIDENKSYTFKSKYDYSVTRNFSDNSHVVTETGTSSEMSGSVKGKDIGKFFEINQVNEFGFTFTVDGFIDDESEE